MSIHTKNTVEEICCTLFHIIETYFKRMLVTVHRKNKMGNILQFLFVLGVHFKRDCKCSQEGEMEEVLRALDEENARLTSLSHRSNWSDSVRNYVGSHFCVHGFC